jgi:hypothetical protein
MYRCHVPGFLNYKPKTKQYEQAQPKINNGFVNVNA